MSVTRSHEARRHTMHGFTFHSLATPSLGGSDLAIWVLEVPKGAEGPAHTMTKFEVFVVQAGELVATLGGEDVQLSIGDALIVPPGTALQLRNPNDEVASALVCTHSDMQAIFPGGAVSPPWAS